MAGGIRIASGQFRDLTEEDLLFARQLGASGVKTTGAFVQKLLRGQVVTVQKSEDESWLESIGRGK